MHGLAPKVWIWDGASCTEDLGEKSQGLLDLDRLGVAVPDALIFPGDVFRAAPALADLQRAIVGFVDTLADRQPACLPFVSLRGGARNKTGAPKRIPVSVLNLGRYADASVSRRASWRDAHASAFFQFFGQALPEAFPSTSLEDQLACLLEPLGRHLATASDLETRSMIVQRMVDGDRDVRSLTGMCYTRHPHTGESVDYGHFIVGRQGLALGGVDDPLQRDLSEMRDINPAAYLELKRVCVLVEEYYGDIRQLEYTAEGSRLYIQQNTIGNRTHRL